MNSNYCDICLVILTSENTKSAHFNSKIHLANEQFKEKLKKNQTRTAFNCIVCCKEFDTFNVLEVHLNSEQHKDKLRTMEHINKFYRNIFNESNKQETTNQTKVLSKSITVSSISSVLKDNQLTAPLNPYKSDQVQNTFFSNMKSVSDLNINIPLKKSKTDDFKNEDQDDLTIRYVKTESILMPYQKIRLNDENQRWELISRECEKLIEILNLKTLMS